MKSRLLFCFLVLGAMARAEDLSASSREISIVAPAQSRSDGSFSVTFQPLKLQRITVAGEQQDSTEQGFGIGFEQKPFDLLTVGYYSGAYVFRQDAAIFDDLAETSRVMMSWINKSSLALKLPAALALTGSAEAKRGFADEQAGYSDAMKYASALEWSPFKDVTKFRMEVSTQETHAVDTTVLTQNVYVAALEQKLPAMPLTLRVTESWSEDRVAMLPERDKDAAKLDAALLWKIRPEATWTLGVQSQDAVFDMSKNLETQDAMFMQMDLRPTSLLNVTMRVARENRTRSDDGELLSDDSATVLGLGLNLKMAETFDAGFGVQYRMPDSQPATTPVTPNLPSFSISARAKF